jgi:DNA-binding transcriptional regulator YhcF (GntR family)
MADRMPSVVQVDPRSAVPPFEQVRAQLAALIDSGRIEPEEQLPTVRQLAGDLHLAVNTVARSYRELEAAGLVETRGRHGTFVAGSPTPQRREAVRATRDFAEVMRCLGIGPREALAIVRRELGLDSGPTGPHQSGRRGQPA